MARRIASVALGAVALCSLTFSTQPAGAAPDAGLKKSSHEAKARREAHPRAVYSGLTDDESALLNELDGSLAMSYDFGEYAKDTSGVGIESFVNHVKGFVDAHGMDGGVAEAKRAMESDEKRLLKLMKIFGYDIRLMEKWADDRLASWVNDNCVGSSWVPAYYYPSVFIGPEWELRLVRCQYALFPLPAEYQVDPKTGDPVYFAAVWDPILECVTPRLRYTPPRYKHAYVLPPDYNYKECEFPFDWIVPGKYGPKVFKKDLSYGINDMKRVEYVPRKYEKYPILRVKRPKPGVLIPGYNKRGKPTAFEFPGYKNRFVFAPGYFKPYHAAYFSVFPAYFFAGYSPKAKAYYANQWISAYYKPGYPHIGTYKEDGGFPAYLYFNDWGLDPYFRFGFKGDEQALTYTDEYYPGYLLGLENQPKTGPWIAAGYYIPQTFKGKPVVSFDLAVDGVEPEDASLANFTFEENVIDISVPGYKVAPIPYALRYSGNYTPGYYKYWRNWAHGPPDMPDKYAGWKATVFAGKPWNRYYKRTHQVPYGHGAGRLGKGKRQQVGVEAADKGYRGNGGWPSYRPAYVVGKTIPVGGKYGYKWYAAYFPAYAPYKKAPRQRYWPENAYPGFEPAYKAFPAYAPIGFKPAYSVKPEYWSPGYKDYAWQHRYVEPFDYKAYDLDNTFAEAVDYLEHKWPGMRRENHWPGYLKAFYPGSVPYGGYFDEEGGGAYAPWWWKQDTDEYKRYKHLKSKYANITNVTKHGGIYEDSYNLTKYAPAYKQFARFYPGYGWLPPVLTYAKFGGSPHDKVGTYPGYFGVKNLIYDFNTSTFQPGYKYWYNPPAKTIAKYTFPNYEDYIQHYEKQHGKGGKFLEAREFASYVRSHPTYQPWKMPKREVRYPPHPRKRGWTWSDVQRAKKEARHPHDNEFHRERELYHGLASNAG